MARARHRALARRTVLAGAAAALASGRLPALAATIRARPLRPLTFVTPLGYQIGFAPDLVGKAGGYFEREGLDVTLEGGHGGSQSLQQVQAGHALLSRASGAVIMKAIADEGAPLVVVATVDQASPFFVISKRTAPVRGPHDMPGKTIGVITKGGGSENLLDAMLAGSGIAPDTVRREAVGDSPGAFGLIEAGRIHAFVGALDTLIALESAGAPIDWFSTDAFAPLPGDAYVATRATVAREPDTIVRYLRGVRHALDAMLADEPMDRTLALLDSFDIAGLKDRAAAKATLKANKALWLAAGKKALLRNVPQRWQHGRDLLARVGAVKPGPASELYTNELIDKALR
jgi:ABC-type nitrate/sulfonate/bicarbonate transport system substrate-binding protein